MRLSTRLALVGVGLTVYVSLYPFAGWRDVGVAPLGFLVAPLPRVVTAFDLASNALAYLPLGFLLHLSLARRLGQGAAALAGVLLALLLSVALEGTQNYLPTRVASSLDVASNGLGALCGVALAMRWGHLAAPRGRWDNAWRALRDGGRDHDVGVAVLLLWLLAQWSPQLPLFAIGALRPMLGIEAPGAFSVARFVTAEALAVGAGLLVLGLFAADLLRRRRARFAVAVLTLGAAIKALGALALGARGDALLWATPGALRGVAGGLLLLLLCADLRPGLRRAVALLALLTASALYNLIPDNPYVLPSVPGFPAAQWLNFNGLSRIAALLWPLFALSWLLGARRER